jgi:hypothetical protein
MNDGHVDQLLDATLETGLGDLRVTGHTCPNEFTTGVGRKDPHQSGQAVEMGHVVRSRASLATMRSR